MRFSERMGLVPGKLVQQGSMDYDLRNSLWNVIAVYFFINASKDMDEENTWESKLYGFAFNIFSCFFKLPVEGIRNLSTKFIISEIKEKFYGLKWYEVYDLIEHIVSRYTNDNKEMPQLFNAILTREKSAYRFVAGKIVPITNEEEISEIEKVSRDDMFTNVQAHINAAITLLSKKPEPDYRNSIKESISAVESMAQIVTNKPNATLSDSLKVLFKNKKLHKSLNAAFQSLYGYAGDSDGIRHAMMDEPSLTVADARYFMVSCSAFINYLKSLMPA